MRLHVALRYICEYSEFFARSQNRGTFLTDRRPRFQAVNDEDHRLVRDALAGQSAAFSELVRRHQDRLFSSVLRIVGRPEDAADIVQEAFVNAWQSLAGFHGHAEFSTWLYRIAYNATISWQRKQRPMIHFSAHRNGTTPIDPVDQRRDSIPGEVLDRNEEAALLQTTLLDLNVEHRQVLILKDFEGMKYEQIAEILNVPIGTVRSRLHRARLELHARMQQKSRASVEQGRGVTETC